MFKKKRGSVEQARIPDPIDLSIVTSTMASLGEKKKELTASEGETIRDITRIEEAFDALRQQAEALCDKIRRFREHVENISHGSGWESSEQIMHEICEEAEDIYTDVEKEQSYYDELNQRIIELKQRVQKKNGVLEETDEMLIHLDEVLATLEHRIQGK